jgi:hypothetical protein
MEHPIIAPCGIDCYVCDANIATRNGDIALLQKLADDYKSKFGKDLDPITLYCDGCPTEGRHIGFCAQCGIRSCAFGKCFKTCAECEEFPCETGSFIWKEGSQSKAKLDALKKLQL